MLHSTQKAGIIKGHATHDTDTGSPEVQAALFTEEIDRLQKHLDTHKKDNSSRRGLLKLVSKRRRILSYLKRIKPEAYVKLTKKLGLKAK